VIGQVRPVTGRYPLGVAKSPALQDQTANVILEHAARVLAEHRDAASLADIAQAAGIARSTLYRYFPNRDALGQALAHRAAEELQARIQEAEPDTLPVPEAIARITRGFIATGAKYVALAYLSPKPTGAADSQLNDPLLRLFERGINDGSLRNDLPVHTLLSIYGDLIQGAITRATHAHHGVEAASAAILTVFLNGTIAPPQEGAR
jgi:TetR/AcrR family transcriptional regulator, mexCD-oprJ operon repressor